MSAPAPRKLTGSQAWSARLAEAMHDPAALIAFAGELQAHQDAKAWEDWRNYRLWRNHRTNKIQGLIKGSEPREVARFYGRGYWSCKTEFGRIVIDATNMKLWQLRDHPEHGASAIAAFVVPKHAMIWRMLREMELGLRSQETGEEIQK
jgi:hypothetical protein